MQGFSAWSIRNPIVPLVLFFGLVLAGLMSFSCMKVQDNPDIEFPMVIVQISQPGAAPTEIENQITQRIEAALQGVEGVENLNSTASEGSSQTMVEFEIGTDISQAVNEVKAAVDQARGELPEGILEPQVFRAQTSSEPIGYFAVSAPDRGICLYYDAVAGTLLQELALGRSFAQAMQHVLDFRRPTAEEVLTLYNEVHVRLRELEMLCVSASVPVGALAS